MIESIGIMGTVGMRSGARQCGRWVLALLSVSVGVACDDPLLSQESFYEARVQPALQVGCVQQTAGCHLADERGTATGNLDLSSFDALMRRDDALPAYGPYPLGLLLLKGGPSAAVTVETFDPNPATGEPFVRVDTDIRHNAGRGIALDSAGFQALKGWIEAGFTRSGVPPEVRAESIGPCRSGAGRAPGFDPAAEPLDAESFRAFRDRVQPVLRQGCAGSTCHGNPIADFYVSCGDTEEELRWNFFIAVEHLDAPVSTSELLRRPLTSRRGGTFHEGGDVFLNTSDPTYRQLFEWAEDLLTRRPDVARVEAMDEGLRFFANRVQPVLVRKGCMFLNCHSPSMFHDLRLRNGSGGTFSRVATLRNYHMSRLQLALESPDPNESRLIAKNLYPPEQVAGGDGITHRGGSLFEDFGGGGGPLEAATPEDCAGTDADGGDLNEVPAYCLLVRWHELERQALLDAGELVPEGVREVVWVERPPGAGEIRDFDTFRGGADLIGAPASIDSAGALSLGGAGSSMLEGCSVSPGADVRTPAVSWDGSRVAFAARTSADEPLRLYWMNADGSGCEPIPELASPEPRVAGVLTHDFDPAFAPDGRLVFASTRGNLAGPDYGGPTRTPAALQPNANLYVYDPTERSVRQLTFLLNQELAPSFMADGRLIFTAEKRQPGFHQLALRRQNLDGGDYHPLFAQRDSVGFTAATEVVELPDRNLAFIAAPVGSTDGAGTLVVANRSLGPDQDDRPPGDRAYLHAMSLPAPGAFGTIPDVPVRRATDRGLFRSPAPLPTGRVLLSCVPDATSLEGGPFAFELCELDPATGRVRSLGGAAGSARLEAVAVYARTFHEVFESRPDEANGNTRVVPGEDDAVVHVLDFPLLETLLFANTRADRPIDPDVGGVAVFEVRPPPVGTTSFEEVAGQVVEDGLGRMFHQLDRRGDAPLNPDGSVKLRLPGGLPIVLGVTGGGSELLPFNPDDPFEGERIQKESMQFYPGERANQSFPRRLFNAMCGGCHGSISGRELDIGVDVDVLTGASRTQARDQSPVDLR